METKGFKIFFQEEEEEEEEYYLDDPITPFDFEEHTVFSGSEELLRNITIEDPGDVVNMSEEDYEVGLQKSLLQIKVLKKLNERNGNLLRKCRSCSIKLVDCYKFPWYYQNKLEATKKPQYPNTKHNVVKIEEKDKAEIIDLTENEDIVFDNQQAADPIIETYTRLTDKVIQKLKKNQESCENSKNISHHLGNNVLLDSKNFIKNRDNLLVSKKIEKEATLSKDNNNNVSDNVHDKKKNYKKCNKIKNMYTSEQISKTKIKIKKKPLISNADIPFQNNCKEIKEKGRNLNLNAINEIQYNSLKINEKKDNATNEKQQNHCENKQQRIHTYNSYSYPLLSYPVLTKLLAEKRSTSLPNRNISPERFYGCNKPLFSADRIIPHFHENASLNEPEILSKTKSNTKSQKRLKETIQIYETKKNRKTFVSTEALNIGPMVSQIPNLMNNNTMVKSPKYHKEMYDTNADISNISTIHSVSPSQVTYNLPINNGIPLKRSTYASSDVVKDTEYDLLFMNHSKKIAAKLEEERLRYLLPSNLLAYSQIQSMFSKKSTI